MLCCAQTGSGKTLAFLLPMLQRLSERAPPAAPTEGRISEPEALVIAPTRELAQQIWRVALGLTEYLEQRPATLCVSGGERFTPQRKSLQAGGVRLLLDARARPPSAPGR